MDGENNGKTYEKTLYKWMIWGYPYFWKHPFDAHLKMHISELADLSPKKKQFRKQTIKATDGTDGI